VHGGAPSNLVHAMRDDYIAALRMNILLLHDAVPPDAPPDAQDTLLQARAIEAALTELGHTVAVHPVTSDLDALAQRLAARTPALVFNLVESLAGSDATAVAVPALLDGVGIPYTGSRAASLALSNDKCVAKALLVRFGLPTPEWVEDDRTPRPFRADRYIVKARFEHASKDLEDDAIVECDSQDAARNAVRERSRALGRPCFAERFIRGREFNLSVLAGPAEPEVLAPAEIDFSAFPPGKARMVGYRAKWIEDSFEFANTPRTFDFRADDAPLLATLETLARTTFQALQLSGYARVDFRVDDDGPWILEVNANPCLTPDAGFAAALARSGIRYKDAIDRIVRAALGDR
jgi:D-alanine-D-alanine ligase